MRRRIQVTLEIDRIISAGDAREAITAWCPSCACRVSMLSPELASAVTNRSRRTIYRLIEAGHLHHVEDAQERLYVCQRSMSSASE